MWFSFPTGCQRIVVEQQLFNSEAEDKEGRKYFRAPAHFAPRILALRGFDVAEPPVGSPDDLPLADPSRDGAITELTMQVTALSIEAADLRSDLGVAKARIVALVGENAALVEKVAEQAALVEGLQERIDDEGVEDKPALKVGKKP